MNHEQTVTVNDAVVIQVMNRLRSEGWREVLSADRNGRVSSLTTRNGEIQPEGAFDLAFLEAYREEHFKSVSDPTRTTFTRTVPHLQHV